MIKVIGTRYYQNNQEFISLVVPYGILHNNTIVLEYNKDIYGYQRAPKQTHYKKIADSLINEPNYPVSPGSIILGINKEDLEGNFSISTVSDNDLVTNIELYFKNKEFKTKMRIIDGQHRLKGFEYVINNHKIDNEVKSRILNYPLNIIISVSDPNRRRIEVDLFSSINSKAKPIKMDLVILAEFQYDLLEKNSDLSIENYLAVKSIYDLNNGEKCHNWKNAIIIDPNSYKVGCVGLKSFLESITPVCKLSKSDSIYYSEIKDFYERKNYLDKKSELISNFLSSCWNIVFKKWGIEKNDNFINDAENIYQIFYDENYYLQRTMGVLAINKLICEIYKDIKEFDSVLDQFRNIINKSKLSNNDWHINGQFAGLSSFGGILKITNSIKNENKNEA